ncbi:MAG: fliR [Enterobacter kobei]|nr:fliR [Enterobacter kobei]
MLHVTSDQWLHWLSMYFWPLLRVLALISTAPILSERTVPKRVKLGLGLVITFVIAPSLPANDVTIFSANALWLALQQIMIGMALGFTMQFAFAAIRTAGELIGLQMGLSFATFCWRLNFPQWFDAGPAGDDHAADAEHVPWPAQPHGPATLGVRHWLPYHAERRHPADGLADAADRAIL